MSPDSPRVLELGPAGEWLDGGRPWRPDAPFLAVLGDPVAHSLSPRLQTAALRARGLARAYRAVRVPAGRLADLRRAGAPGLAAANVTAPLKEEAAALCDELTPVAARAGAVNTLRLEGGRWIGHNTDVEGLARALGEAWPGSSPPDVGVVLGTGGAARAAVLALLGWGVGRVAARARSVAAGRRFRAWLDRSGAPGAGAVAIEPLAGATGPCPGERAVWVVCLAAGVPAAPCLPAGPRAPASLVLDLRYGDALPDEPRPDLPWRDGRDLLLAQGALSFAWWFGPPVPLAAMRAALG